MGDGTYGSVINTGVWKVIDEKTLWLKNNNNLEYTLKFVDNYGYEALLITPAREPPSRLRAKIELKSPQQQHLSNDSSESD